MDEAVDLVTLGEVMLGLRAPQGSLLENTSSLQCLVAGAEVNVAIGLARLGLKAAWIGKLPRHPLAANLVSTIRGQGVITDHIVWCEDGRLGTMYLELGVPPRANRILYDRKNSAASTLSPEEVNWKAVEKARHFHLTGITPALSASCLATAQKALETARSNNMSISFDVNYRSALWPPEEAGQVLSTLILGVNLLCVSREEAGELFGVKGESEDLARRLRDRYENQIVVVKQGQAGAVLYDGKKLLRSHTYPAVEVNRQGVGDAFLSGVLFGFLNGDLEMGLEYGSAMAALKLTLIDVNYPLLSREDVQDLLRHKGKNGPVPPLGYGGGSYEVKR